MHCLQCSIVMLRQVCISLSDFSLKEKKRLLLLLLLAAARLAANKQVMKARLLAVSGCYQAGPEGEAALKAQEGPREC